MSNIKIRGILRFARFFTPKPFNEGDEPKYNGEILIAKNDPGLPALQTEVNTVLANAFPSGLPSRGTVCLEDCQTKFPDKPMLHNYMLLKANSGVEYKPEVIDTSLQPVMDPAVVRVGTYVWFGVSIAAFQQGSKGVKAYLNAVMLTGEQGPIPEELLSARQSAASIFGDVAPGSTAGAHAPMPATTPMPSAAPGTPGPAPAVAPPAPPAPAPAPSVHQMTASATNTYEEYIASGWTDEMLIQHGLMLPPGGVAPSFM